MKKTHRNGEKGSEEVKATGWLSHGISLFHTMMKNILWAASPFHFSCRVNSLT